MSSFSFFYEGPVGRIDLVDCFRLCLRNRGFVSSLQTGNHCYHCWYHCYKMIQEDQVNLVVAGVNRGDSCILLISMFSDQFKESFASIYSSVL